MSKELIHRVIETISYRYGDLTAVEEESSELSYRELNERGNRLAHLLLSLGILEEETIGVCLGGGVDSVTSLLGCLKSGLVYMPIDLGFSSRRLLQMLGETSPRALIVDISQQASAEALLEMLGVVVPYLVVYSGGVSGGLPGLSADAGELLGLSRQTRVYVHTGAGYEQYQSGGDEVSESWGMNLEKEPQGKNKSYIFYTSGSTGRGKGIAGSHRSLSHYIHWQKQEWGVGPGFRISQLASLTFDASLKDILVSLSSGACLCIPGSGTRNNMVRLGSWLREKRLTQVQCVPSVLRMLMGSLETQASRPVLPDLRYILLAGERLYGRDVQRWRELNGSLTELTNLYGLTETTILKSYYRIPEQDWHGGEVIPVGRPISNTSIAVISGNRLSGREMIGEIYIKSPFMSLGYLESGLNAGLFVQNPLISDRQDLVCRTGDLGRYRSDGNLEVLGRKDEQIKLHGIRIELNEVRSSMLGLAEIKQVELVLHESGDEQSLVCYYTGRERSGSVLREELSRELNSYMIPSYFEWLAEFPVNVNGKVDRKLLPTPGALALKAGYESPEGELEERLSATWQQLLGKEQISRHESFFNMGGSSLKAVQLISRIYKEFDVQLEIGDVFTHPTIAGQAGLIRVSLQQAYEQIPVIAEQEDYVLSHSQKRLWVLDQLQPGMVAYSRPVAYEFRGLLDLVSLERALDTVISRHESLRTIFILTEDGEPRQKILGIHEHGFRLGYEDLRGTEDPRVQAMHLAAVEASSPFELSRGPLLRVRLLQVSEAEYYFLFTIHHIISDEWSMQVLVREVLSLYNSYREGQGNGLPPLRIQYKDYAYWQQSGLKGAGLDRHRSYWSEQFSGEVPVLNLSTDHPRPAVQSYRGGRQEKAFGKSLSGGLQGLMQEQGVTLFMVLLAGLNTLLYRYTGQGDVVIGTPVAGRNDTDLEDQIGFFVNTLALRSQLTGSQTFRELLMAVKAMTLKAYEHQSYPFDRLVEDLNLVRDLSRSPLFDVMLVVNEIRTDSPATEMDQIQVTPVDITATTSLFDLVLRFTEANEGEIYLSIEYNTDLFDSEHIIRMLSHYEHLLVSAVSSPGSALQELNYLGESERSGLLYGFNATETLFPEQETLVSLFESAVSRYPESVALISEGGKELSYRELNESANRLAHYLRSKHKIVPDDLIIICLERSEMLLITILGVLKAGGAYTPLDFDYPLERINYVLRDTQAKLAITQQAYESLFNNQANPQEMEVVIADNEVWKRNLGAFPDSNLSKTINPQNLAYVIYTSGTTGEPKGVMCHHQGIVNRINWMQTAYPLMKTDRVLQKTPYVFDVSVWELFWANWQGAAIVLARPDGHKDPYYLADVIEKTKVTVIHFVPSMLAAFEEMLELIPTTQRQVESIRYLFCSGETLSLDLVSKAKKLMPRANIQNLYGPTEASIDVSYYDCNDPNTGKILIGKPIYNTCVYILDQHGLPLPVGEIGEIYISGVGLAKGYLNKEQETLSSFIQNPYCNTKFQKEKFGRLYKSGDLGKWEKDGNIAYLGRKDHQVKIRGHRIELTEIESRLNLHPMVDSSLVSVHLTPKGEKELVAYIVAKSEIEPETIRDYLNKYLPAFMLPVYYVNLEKLPLTRNGKVDKKLLPKPEDSASFGIGTYTPARSEIENILVELWTELLEKPRIGITEKFFAIGGNSLKAIQMISRIHKIFNLKIELMLLFTHQTILDLGEQIELLQWIKKGQPKDTLLDHSNTAEIDEVTL